MPRVGYRGQCHFCGEEVTPSQPAAYGVLGWEGQRSAGGANQIILRRRVPNRIAHLRCVRERAEMEKRGISVGQESMFG